MNVHTFLSFVFDNIIRKVQFPIIQTDPLHVPQMWKNLPESIQNNTQRIKFMSTMDELNEPIPLIYNDKTISAFTFGYLHYGDSTLVHKLQWWTYIELIAIAAFIFLGFIGFTFIRNNEKRHIWVGMARETAHQLGTPVSALLGWVDWLTEHPEKTIELIPEMKADLKRLEQIGRRFSEMGSEPEMEKFDLSERVTRVVNYLNMRLPTLGKKVELVNDIYPGIMITANGSLLAWSIENIIRNGIDAIDRSDGMITISLKKDGNGVNIQIKDNGRGIPKKDWKNIFRPGFSTKKSGWGLGLSLSMRIVQDIHKGRLQIRESTMNKGTIFEIIL